MLSTARPACFAPRLIAAPVRRAHRSVAVQASGSGFDVDKFVDDLPVPVEYAYAGLAWGAFKTPTVHVIAPEPRRPLTRPL
jgi:hypothetical protein